SVVRMTERQTALQETVKTIEARSARGGEELAVLHEREAALAAGVRDAESALEETREQARATNEALAVVERELEELRPLLAGGEQEHAQALAALNAERGRASSASERRAECAARLTGLREQRDRADERLQSRRNELEASIAQLAQRA